MLFLKSLTLIFVFILMDYTSYIPLTFLLNMPKPETFLKHLQKHKFQYSMVMYFFLFTIWAMVSFPNFSTTFFCEI